MSRTGKIKKRTISPDPIYSSKLLEQFINSVMKDGKKSIAQKQVYRALKAIEKKKLDPLEVFQAALQNVSPRMEVRSRRVGGASYQVPIEVRGKRRISLAIRWIIEAANKRPNTQYKTFSDKLEAELLDAYNREGEAIRKKQIMHRNAEANRAFSHFRW